MTSRKPSRALPRLVLLWLAGIDLRLTILALPPVLPLIHRDLDLSEKLVAALTGLPVLLFAIVAIPGSLLIARTGARRALLTGLVLTALGSAGRGLGPSTPLLFAMTFVMGAGISVMQPALPALVSEWFEAKPGLATAVYANGLLVGEVLGAALTLPLVLPLAGGSWGASFALWSLPVLATAALIAGTTPSQRPRLGTEAPLWWPDWRDAQTWQVGVVLGGGSCIYFAANAFIPDYLSATGAGDLIGVCLTSLNAGQLPASFVVLGFSERITGKKGPLVALTLVSLGGLGLLLVPLPWARILGAGVLGFAAAFALILTLALPPMLAEASDVHRLSAGMFAIGYLTAFIVPLLGGVAWDATGVPASAFLPIVLGAGMVLWIAARLRPHRVKA
ncbi:MAG TPA: MFS transporter [Stellaceae bacterium]|nr:MFS transporter [Stellaceae bacterium]